MTFEQVEQLKRQLTDKYVEVREGRPDMARFKGHVGQVKTVNMSGLALVQFLDYHANIGWYDIDVDQLNIVEKPPEKEAKPQKVSPAEKPATARKTEPLPRAAAGGEAAKAPSSQAPATKASASKMSVADILAAARAQKGGGPPTVSPEKSAGVGPKTPPKSPPAAAATSASPTPAKLDPSKMSVADILAAARAGSGEKRSATAAAATADTAAESAVPSSPTDRTAAHQVMQGEPERPEAMTPTQTSAAAAPKSSTPETKATSARLDRSKMSVAEMLAYCRDHDRKA
jgi:hypothetical protein